MSDRYKGAILSPTAPTVTPQSAGGIYTSSQQLQYQGQGVWPSAFNNPINNSLRFRASASAYLNRTQTTPTTATKWTYSYWVKRGIIGGSSVQTMVSGTGGGGSGIVFYNDKLWASSYSGGYQWNFLSAAVYRDPSAWYHIMVAYDSTQATDTNRVKIYVNGVQVTAFSTDVGAITYPTQNTVGQVGGVSGGVRIGLRDDGFYYFDGYLAEFNFVDGQQLTPSSFGTTDAYGIWQPIPYTGTYGNNGFYLPFTDNSALTTSSNVGLGKDFSGNGNYWVTNNISITSGTTYDSMTDVPTNTNLNTANYCTLNPLDQTSAVTLSAANLNYSCSSGSQGRSTLGSPTTGFWYFEHTITSSIGLYTPIVVGACTNTKPVTDLNNEALVVWFYTDSSAWQVQKRVSGVVTYVDVTGTSYPNTNDVLQIAYDPANGRAWMGKNNNWIDSSGGITGNPSTGANPTFTFTAGQSIFPAVFNVGASYSGVLNCGQRPFSYTPPSGFYPLNTYNLPTPTILDGDQYFNATLYTGNGTGQSITNAGSMQPDFVWVKSRTQATSNYVYDSLRGAGYRLATNLTVTEALISGVTSFDSNGFTVGTETGNNNTGDSYVGWQWRASNAAGVSNTQGTITSTVSANTTAGFSIVTYTGNGTSGATVGHGLGVTPSMVILKQRDGASNWQVKHVSLNANQNLILNSTAAVDTAPGSGYISAISSTTLTLLNGGSAITNVNANNGTYVAYCFAAVAGYSAFGSYTGNGSSDGPFVYLGFRPRYVLIKASSTTGDWWLEDTTRNPYNAADLVLFPNTSGAESGSGVYYWDFLSNGFKLRSTSAGYNGSGTTYIYMAFAENPFKIARGR